MPETNALPTDEDLLFVRADIEDTYPDNTTIEEWLAQGLAQVKQDLDNERDLLWKQVYDTTNDEYFDGEDETGRNERNIKQMIMFASIYLCFEQFSIRAGEDSEWWRLYLHYENKYMNLLKSARLDIDRDEDGAIDSGEEGELGITFLSK
jgi:hypothetical protein